MRLLFALLLLAAFVLLPAVALAANPLGARELTMRVVQSGFLYVREPVATAAITLAVPQNTHEQTVQKFSVEPDISEFVKDGDNSVLKLRWTGLHSGAYNYTVESIVKSSRRTVSDLEIAADARWTADTEHVQLTDRVRELSWRYRDAASLSDVAAIVGFAHSMLRYDEGAKPRTIQNIFLAGVGDGTSHAMLLAALLRATGVPTRIVVGDALLPSGQISDHSWVEVLADDGTWVPFDSALMRGGSAGAYITKWAGADLPAERVEFIGGGNVSWQPNPDRVEILDSKAAPVLAISPMGPDVTFPRNQYGWLGVAVRPSGCGFWHLSPVSCIDASNRSVLSFNEPERAVWSCNSTDVFWTFSGIGTNYVCPVRIDDATGAYTIVNATVDNVTTVPNITIAGLESVPSNRGFDLVAVGIDPAREHDMLFYSPTLNERSLERAWHLQLKPGVYNFYLWFEGALAKKGVGVLEPRAFAIALSSPESVEIYEPLDIRIDVANVLNASVDGTLKLRTDNALATFCWRVRNVTECSDSYGLTLEPLESRALEFTTNPAKGGAISLTASVENSAVNSAAFASKTVRVLAPSARQVERASRLVSQITLGLLRGLLVLPRTTLRVG